MARDTPYQKKLTLIFSGGGTGGRGCQSANRGTLRHRSPADVDGLQERTAGRKGCRSCPQSRIAGEDRFSHHSEQNVAVTRQETSQGIIVASTF